MKVESGVLRYQYDEQPGPHRLGRHMELDGRSLAYAVEEARVIKPAEWPSPVPTLDQGSLGSCTGNAGTYHLAAIYGGAFTQIHIDGFGLGPDATMDEQFAIRLYEEATVKDGFPGCLVAGQRVLTTDLRWVPVETLVHGDRLIGFDENASNTSRYREAEVLGNKPIIREVVEVVTDRGTVMCSADHLFVRAQRHSHDRRAWIRASHLKPGEPIVRLMDPCDQDMSYEAGWLSGFFDGEGCVNGRVSVVQNQGATLEKARQIIAAKGYLVGALPRSGRPKQIELRLQGGSSESLRFLTQFRPERLVINARAHWNGMGTSLRSSKPAVVQSVKALGKGEVWATKTSTETLVVEGLLSHNSYPPDDTGSSGLGICRALKAEKLITRYSWALSRTGFATLLQHAGCIIGMPWYNAFFDPDADGFIDASYGWQSSGVAGGHEVYVEALEAWNPVDPHQCIVRFHNSWGDWGDYGCGRMRLSTYEALKSEIDLKQFHI
jgi:hypothetical protein